MYFFKSAQTNMSWLYTTFTGIFVRNEMGPERIIKSKINFKFKKDGYTND